MGLLSAGLAKILTKLHKAVGQDLTITRKGLAGQGDLVFIARATPGPLSAEQVAAFQPQGDTAVGLGEAYAFEFVAGTDIRRKDLIAYKDGIFVVERVTSPPLQGDDLEVLALAILQSQT